VLGGADLNEANDKLVLDTELALNADIAKVFCLHGWFPQY
jgi:hypothetical protein